MQQGGSGSADCLIDIVATIDASEAYDDMRPLMIHDDSAHKSKKSQLSFTANYAKLLQNGKSTDLMMQYDQCTVNRCYDVK